MTQDECGNIQEILSYYRNEQIIWLPFSQQENNLSYLVNASDYYYYSFEDELFEYWIIGKDTFHLILFDPKYNHRDVCDVVRGKSYLKYGDIIKKEFKICKKERFIENTKKLNKKLEPTEDGDI